MSVEMILISVTLRTSEEKGCIWLLMTMCAVCHFLDDIRCMSLKQFVLYFIQCVWGRSRLSSVHFAGAGPPSSGSCTATIVGHDAQCANDRERRGRLSFTVIFIVQHVGLFI